MIERYCFNCPSVLEDQRGPDALAPGCNGPVFIIEAASHVTNIRHEAQYADPDQTHQPGEVYCGRDYAAPTHGPEYATEANRLWIEMRAAQADTDILDATVASRDALDVAHSHLINGLGMDGNPLASQYASDFSQIIHGIKSEVQDLVGIDAAFRKKLGEYLLGRTVTNLAATDYLRLKATSFKVASAFVVDVSSLGEINTYMDLVGAELKAIAIKINRIGQVADDRGDWINEISLDTRNEQLLEAAGLSWETKQRANEAMSHILRFIELLASTRW